ncbi:MAG: exonuclease domain-containing protein [Alphaproteobacteria bacterium]
MKYIIYDFETTGRSARFDQILQAGFIVYNNDFNEIDKRNIKSRLSPDVIPSINALRVNRLRMSELLSEKNSIYEAAIKIKNFLSSFKDSFYIGFNSIAFDEEFLRQLFWEHFYFPYISNTNGNLRGDLYHFVTMTHAFNQDILNVEKNDDGKLSFKLEKLAKANNFDSSNSHEAIADVEVTMKLLELLAKKKKDFFKIFINNATARNVENTISENDLFTLHNYMFSSHRVYLVKKLLKHPSYKNQYIGFDMKYDARELSMLSEKELKEEYRKKSFFRKIKLNKQPNILDKRFALKFKPYEDFSEEEIRIKCKYLENEDFLKKINNIFEKESTEYLENQSQELKLEEDTIYSQNINFNDSQIMQKFHTEAWENKWSFAERFRDQRLRFFAAKHIFRNYPDQLPRKIFTHFHQKVSERLCSLEKQHYLTIPEAMNEADNISLELEEKKNDVCLNEQLEQYNIYINFLNDYYKQQNPKPLAFDSTLSKELFG